MKMLKCGNSSVWYQREPTIAEVLSDSLVKVVMRADGVDPQMLERDLRSMAQTVQSNTRIGDDGFTPRSSPRKRGPRGQALNALKVWIPASAETNGECGAG
jgi:hypothetical protein